MSRMYARSASTYKFQVWFRLMAFGIRQRLGERRRKTIPPGDNAGYVEQYRYDRGRTRAFKMQEYGNTRYYLRTTVHSTVREFIGTRKEKTTLAKKSYHEAPQRGTSIVK